VIATSQERGLAVIRTVTTVGEVVEVETAGRITRRRT
jgi:hypothetical protein